MKLKNPFSDDTRLLFYPVRYRCFICKGNGQDVGGIELHHILGRISSSPYNAAPLCKKCHAQIGHAGDEEQKLMYVTKRYLDKTGYVPTDDDDQFLAQHYEDRYTSVKQTKGLHLWLGWLSDALNEAGIPYHEVFTPEIEVRFTKENLKGLWKAIQIAQTGKESHRDLTQDEFDSVQEVFDEIMVKNGIVIEFPSEELKSREEQARSMGL